MAKYGVAYILRARLNNYASEYMCVCAKRGKNVTVSYYWQMGVEKIV